MTDNSGPDQISVTDRENSAGAGRRSIQGMRLAKSAGKWLLVLAVGIALGLLLYVPFPNISLPFAKRHDGGFILVDSPEVYSRERLLNDRLRQHGWLMRRLDDADSLRIRNQAIVEQSDRIKAGGKIRVEAGVLGSKAPGAGAPLAEDGKAPAEKAEKSTLLNGQNAHGAGPAKPAGSKIDDFRDLLAYREEIRAELLETQLDDRHDINGNTLYRMKFDVTVLPQERNQNWAFIEVRLRNADGDKDKMDTYNRWLRDTQQRLNDYLFELTQSFFTRKTTPKVLLELENFLRGEIGDNSQAPAAFAKSKPNNRPTSESSSSPYKNCRGVDISQRVDCSEIFFDRIINLPYPQQVFGNFEPTLDLGQDREFEYIRSFILDYMRLVYGELNDHQDQSRSNVRYSAWLEALDEATDAVPGAHENLDTLFKKPEFEPIMASPGSIRGPELQNLLNRFRSDELFGQVHHAFRLSNAAFELERQVIQSAIADFVVNKYLQLHDLARFANLEKTGCDVGYCNISMSPGPKPETKGSFAGCAPKIRPKIWPDVAENGETKCPDMEIVKDFYSALDNAPVYSYTSSPKESIQRVTKLYSQLRELNLALNTAATATSSANFESLLSHLRSQEQRIQTIKRQPLIVGFSDRQFAQQGAQAAAPKSTHFGWLIGPKFDISDEPTFRHVPIQNSVAAVLSVPSWWKRAMIEVSSCFIAPEHTTMILSQSDPIRAEPVCGARKNEAKGGTRRSKRNFEFKIRLPGRTDEIPRKMGYALGRSPRLTSLGSLGELYVGQKSAKLLLMGVDLWRSTVVTLGSQKADQIEILPDMKGIIATFLDVKAPMQWGIEVPGYGGGPSRTNFCMADAEIFVWTSEGRTEPQNVTIYQTKEDFKRGRCTGIPPEKHKPPRDGQPEDKETEGQGPGNTTRPGPGPGTGTGTGPAPGQ